MLLERTLRKGGVAYALLLVEGGFAAVSNDREPQAAWTKWYEGVLSTATA